MLSETTITICGQTVKMRYCAAAETGFEKLTGKRIDVFSPTPIEFGEDGKPTRFEKPSATIQDYLMLGCASIVAAYTRDGTTAPVGSADILYDAQPKEITDLCVAVINLRSKWYKVPEVIEPAKTKKGPKVKNAQPPTTSSRK